MVARLILDQIVKVRALVSVPFLRPHSQAVKTPPSHGGNRGSIPLGATIETLLFRALRSEKNTRYIRKESR